MSEYLITAPIIGGDSRKVKRHGRNVVHAAASLATHVVVALEIAVKTGFRSGKFQFTDHSHSGQELQISIYGAEADFWETTSNELVQHRCGGVRGDFLEFLQNHPSLSGTALRLLSVHAATNC
jgi:hypothetical protein